MHTFTVQSYSGLAILWRNDGPRPGCLNGSYRLLRRKYCVGCTPGPRIAYGGFQYYSDWAFDEDQGRGIEPEADPEHIRRAVDLSEAFGAQHIKTRTFRRWDINARMIDEAHRRGMRVTGHCSHCCL
jgi:hypothetical protein